LKKLSGAVGKLAGRATRDDPGFILIDSSGTPIYFNREAVKILTYGDQHNAKVSAQSLIDKVRSVLPWPKKKNEPNAPILIKSGRRRYVCRVFSVSERSEGSRPLAALLFERSSVNHSLALLGKKFRLTRRESESVNLLAQGLTGKEIAHRMGISPNTVKAFMRSVMIKTGATTRSGIIGKVLQVLTYGGKETTSED